MDVDEVEAAPEVKVLLPLARNLPLSNEEGKEVCLYLAETAEEEGSSRESGDIKVQVSETWGGSAAARVWDTVVVTQNGQQKLLQLAQALLAFSSSSADKSPVEVSAIVREEETAKKSPGRSHAQATTATAGQAHALQLTIKLKLEAGKRTLLDDVLHPSKEPVAALAIAFQTAAKQLATGHTAQQEQAIRLKKYEDEHERFRRLLESKIVDKDKVQDELIAKFVLVLNTKKAEIRRLRERVGETDAAEDDDMEEEEDQGSARSEEEEEEDDDEEGSDQEEEEDERKKTLKKVKQQKKKTGKGDSGGGSKLKRRPHALEEEEEEGGGASKSTAAGKRKKSSTTKTTTAKTGREPGSSAGRNRASGGAGAGGGGKKRTFLPPPKGTTEVHDIEGFLKAKQEHGSRTAPPPPPAAALSSSSPAAASMTTTKGGAGGIKNRRLEISSSSSDEDDAYYRPYSSSRTTAAGGGGGGGSERKHPYSVGTYTKSGLLISDSDSDSD